MAYGSVSDVKTYLGISGSGDDTLLTAIVARAKSVIDERMGFTFDVSADSDRYFDVRRSRDGLELPFDTWLAAAPTTILNKADDASPETIASGNYVMLPRNHGGPYWGLRLLGSKGYSWSYSDDPESGIKITGKWGWSATAPDSVVHAHIRLCAYLYRQKGTASELDRPMLTEAGVTILPSQIPNDVLKILDPYRWRGGVG